MGVRFCSPNIAFRIEGRPICRGGRAAFGGTRKEPLLNQALNKKPTAKDLIRAKNQKHAANSKQYANVIRLMAKSAMAANGWTISNEPVYIVITFYINYPYKRAKEDIDIIYKTEMPATTGPLITSTLKHYIKWLEGVVFEKDSQVVATLVLKRYTKGNEHTDVLIGRPKSYGDIIYDIRNI